MASLRLQPRATSLVLLVPTLLLLGCTPGPGGNLQLGVKAVQGAVPGLPGCAHEEHSLLRGPALGAA